MAKDFERAIETMQERAKEIEIGDVELQDLIDDYELAAECLKIVRGLRDVIA